METREPTGRHLGAYEILSQLATGGMGEVYEVRHRVTGVLRALKVLRRELAQNEQFVERFMREVRLAASVQHENLVQVFEPGMEGDVVFLPMELLRGETLADLLIRRGPMPPPVASQILRQVASGVAALHAHGVIHRDIKPMNIFLADQPTGAVIPKVLDLGSARKFDDTESTTTGFVIGSIHYMAPEQAAGLKELDVSIDQFALGVVGYQLVTGRRPYEHDGQGHALAKLVRDDPYPDIATLRGDVPAPYAAAVRKAMGRQPQDRFPSLDAFAQALEGGLDTTIPGSPNVVTHLPPPAVIQAAGGLEATIHLDEEKLDEANADPETRSGDLGMAGVAGRDAQPPTDASQGSRGSQADSAAESASAERAAAEETQPQPPLAPLAGFPSSGVSGKPSSRSADGAPSTGSADASAPIHAEEAATAVLHEPSGAFRAAVTSPSPADSRAAAVGLEAENASTMVFEESRPKSQNAFRAAATLPTGSTPSTGAPSDLEDAVTLAFHPSDGARATPGSARRSRAADPNATQPDLMTAWVQWRPEASVLVDWRPDAIEDARAPGQAAPLARRPALSLTPTLRSLGLGQRAAAVLTTGAVLSATALAALGAPPELDTTRLTGSSMAIAAGLKGSASENQATSPERDWAAPSPPARLEPRATVKSQVKPAVLRPAAPPVADASVVLQPAALPTGGPPPILRPAALSSSAPPKAPGSAQAQATFASPRDTFARSRTREAAAPADPVKPMKPCSHAQSTPASSAPTPVPTLDRQVCGTGTGVPCM